MVTCNIALKAWLRLQGVQLTLKIESFNNHVERKRPQKPGTLFGIFP